VQVGFSTISSAQVDLLNQAYDALKYSVYQGIIMQTRLSTYCDDIIMQQIGDDFSWDFSGLTTRLDNYRQTDPSNAYIDLIELNRFSGLGFETMGWDSFSLLRQWVVDAQGNSSLQSVLSQMNVQMGTGTLNGQADGDIIMGQNGNAVLSGKAGNDILDGSSGNDTMKGDEGSDVYLFGIGDGHDTINNY